jgi:uncharacterized protein
MPLIIDGHNLIPKIPGMHLSDLNDEMRLVGMLQDYARIRRKGPVECYFDKAPVGQPRTQKIGIIKVQFARPGQTADDDIEMRLSQLGREARNYTVVSADQRVRRAARGAGAIDLSSDEFVKDLIVTLKSGDLKQEKPKKPSMEEKLSGQEVDMWLNMFRDRKKDDQEKTRT